MSDQISRPGPRVFGLLTVGLLACAVGALFVLPSHEASALREGITAEDRSSAPSPNKPAGVDRRLLNGESPLLENQRLPLPEHPSPPSSEPPAGPTEKSVDDP